MNTLPIRVLHCLGSFDHGGIESWLLQVLRRVDRDHFRMDFLVHAAEEGVHAPEVRSMGSRILSCRPTGIRRPWRYATYSRTLRGLLEEQGPYDIAHGHIQEFSGYFLRAAAKAGVGARIAHSHNGEPPAGCRPNILRRAYSRMMRQWVDRHATLGLACSQVAARSLYGEGWQNDVRWRILPYGIDLAAFSETAETKCEGACWKIPADAPVMGHVGRFVEQKNHLYLLDVFAEVLNRCSDVRLLLVGDGPLRPQVECAVQERGLGQRVLFAGARSDVARLMLSVMDLFVFPSLWEGLPVVVIEAQAAGLPVLMSDHVSPEVVVDPQLVERCSLSLGSREWAERSLRKLAEAKRDRRAALQRMSSSHLTVERSARQLEDVYSAHLERPSA